MFLRLGCSGSCCWKYQCGGCGGSGGGGCDCGSVGGVGLNLYIVSLMKLLSYHLITWFIKSTWLQGSSHLWRCFIFGSTTKGWKRTKLKQFHFKLTLLRGVAFLESSLKSCFSLAENPSIYILHWWRESQRSLKES